MTTDLNEPQSPELIPSVLHAAARNMMEQAAELNSAWQDSSAGKPWEIIALELIACANRIQRRLP
jgi:hypothetical protein